MYLRNRTLSIAFKLILVLIGTMGLLAKFGVFEGRFQWSVLNYFTILSNLLCVVYFGVDIGHLAKRRRNEAATTWNPALKGVAMMSITITMLISHFLLKLGFSLDSWMGFSLLPMHYLVPLMTILDWLWFDKKGLITKTSPLLWTIAPIGYLVYAMTAAQIGDGIGDQSRYPYSFIDVDKLGWGQVLLTVLILLIVFIALGYVYLAIDRMLFKLGNRNHRHQQFQVYHQPIP